LETHFAYGSRPTSRPWDDNTLVFFALHHAVHLCNYLPIMIDGYMTTSFELIHQCQPNYQAILYPNFSHGYLRRVLDGSRDQLQLEPQSQPIITIVRSELANCLMFWNPTTNSISVSADYILDPLGHRTSPFNIKFDSPLEFKPSTSHLCLSKTKAPPPEPQSCMSQLTTVTRQTNITTTQ
jgi:hypothetical protein